MLFTEPLIPARLARRYKRFLADVILADGQMVTVHCANPGAMLGLAVPGTPVYLSRAANPARKLPWSWELARIGDGLVGINTAQPNRLVEEALRAGAIPELAGYAGLRREVGYGTRSRVDFLLTSPGRPDCYVEVKNVHLKRDAAVPGLAEFPDSVTARGTRHLEELALRAAAGDRAVMLYLVQREDCDRCTIAGDIDPRYAAALRQALAAGLETLCYSCSVSLAGIRLDRRLTFLAAGERHALIGLKQ